MARQAPATRRRVAEPEAKPTRRAKAEPAPEPKRRAKPAAEAPVKRTRAKAEPEPTPKRRAVKEVEEAPVKRGRAKPAAEPAPKRGRAKPVEEAEEAPAKPARGKKAAAAATSEAFNPYAMLDDVLDDIEKHVGLSESSMETDGRMSTGNLMLDLILGGGITAGWYTNFGQEQSCKTTGAVTIMAAAINANVPIKYYFDFEGSATPDYIENIMRNIGVKADVKSIFGVRDEKTGKYIVSPTVRYKSEAVAEKFFDTLASLERKLPDKKKIGSTWYYIYESKKMVKGKLVANKENAAIVGHNYDEAYFKKTGRWRIPAPDGSLQALILVDSYPAMLPEGQDVEDPNSSIAVQARMFSAQLQRVKGRMKGKRIAVIGINQLRKVPMAMYGPSESEPCGEALKLYSDVRLKFTSRSLSGVSKDIGEAVKGKGQVEEEPSVQVKGGVDNYRYIHVRGHKNKLSRPYLEHFLRLWITDAEGQAQGFDPVFDTFMYMKATGQLSGKRAKMLLKINGNEATRAIGWLDFKRLIVGDRATIKAVCEKAGMKPIQLRAKCFTQMVSGTSIELYNKESLNSRNRKAEKSKVDEAVEEGDDDNE